MEEIFWNCLHFPLNLSQFFSTWKFSFSWVFHSSSTVSKFSSFYFFPSRARTLFGRMFWVVDVSFFSLLGKLNDGRVCFTHVVTLKSLKWIKFWWTWELWAFYRIFLARDRNCLMAEKHLLLKNPFLNYLRNFYLPWTAIKIIHLWKDGTIETSIWGNFCHL